PPRPGRRAPGSLSRSAQPRTRPASRDARESFPPSRAPLPPCACSPPLLENRPQLSDRIRRVIKIQAHLHAPSARTHHVRVVSERHLQLRQMLNLLQPAHHVSPLKVLKARTSPCPSP